MRSLFSLFASSLLLGCSFLAAAAAEHSKPNIIVILVDDMGYSDLGCYGSEIPTPNIDALAKDGLRFTQFYNASRCSPSRASILTGLYPHEAGIGCLTDEDVDSHFPGYIEDLNHSCATLAEVLRPAGYATYAVGKWHVTKYVNATPTQKFNWPLQRGFDRYFGIIAGGANYFHPDSLTLGNQRLAPPGDGFYTTDAFVDKAITYVKDTPKNKPFFLYLAFNAPHFPLMAPAGDIAKFRHRVYTAGWDKLREARYERQKALGLIDPSWALSPRPEEIKAWDSLAPAEKDRFDDIMSIYAACVWHMDKEVGVLVDFLRQRGALDNTLILFLSDNGGNAESGPDGVLTGSDPGGPKSAVFCGESWANLENTPFRLYKHFEHEGGISTPLIVHWPDGFAAKNKLRTEPGHIIDIMPTLADVGGANYPTTLNGHAILPMEGRSLKPAFTAKPLQPRDALFWEHEGNAAVREGDWKLVRRDADGAWELYNLKTDRTEQHNLVAAEPKRAMKMLARWTAWAKRTHVIPAPPYPKDALTGHQAVYSSQIQQAALQSTKRPAGQ